MMRVSKQIFQDHFQVPTNWAFLPTYKLFEKVGLVFFGQAGFPTFLPVGQRIVNAVNNIIKEEAVRGGFEEMYFPLIQNVALLEKTGRADQFNSEFFRFSSNNLILTPTNEEVYSDLVSQTTVSYRQLPIRLFQIADKFRNITRTKGIFRSKEFLMCDMVSIDIDQQMLRQSAESFERIALSVFERLGIDTFRIEKNQGRYVDFVIECAEGNTYIQHSPDRYEKGGLPASSVAMYFLFDHSGPPFRQAGNGISASCLGSYGFGIQRCMHAIVEQHRDELGIDFPKSVRPFDSSVIVLNPDDKQQLDLAEECYSALSVIGARPLFDDRFNKTFKEKACLADFFGIPFKLIIGRRESANRIVKLKWRDGSEEEISPNPDNLLKLICK